MVTKSHSLGNQRPSGGGVFSGSPWGASVSQLGKSKTVRRNPRDRLWWPLRRLTAWEIKDRQAGIGIINFPLLHFVSQLGKSKDRQADDLRE